MWVSGSTYFVVNPWISPNYIDRVLLDFGERQALGLKNSGEQLFSPRLPVKVKVKYNVITENHNKVQQGAYSEQPTNITE